MNEQAYVLKGGKYISLFGVCGLWYVEGGNGSRLCVYYV
jgi:hypothetical protein